jgi:hypothetical protein
MEKLVVYSIMSFNKRYVPELDVLISNHQMIGDVYLERFESCDSLIGSPESIKYLDEFFNKKYETYRIEEAFKKIKDATELLKKYPQYSMECENIEQILDSLTNKQ